MVTDKFNAGVTLHWTSIPFRGEQKYFRPLHATETRDKRWPDGPLGSYTGFAVFIIEKTELLISLNLIEVNSGLKMVEM